MPRFIIFSFSPSATGLSLILLSFVISPLSLIFTSLSFHTAGDTTCLPHFTIFQNRPGFLPLTLHSLGRRLMGVTAPSSLCFPPPLLVFIILFVILQAGIMLGVGITGIVIIISRSTIVEIWGISAPSSPIIVIREDIKRGFSPALPSHFLSPLSLCSLCFLLLPQVRGREVLPPHRAGFLCFLGSGVGLSLLSSGKRVKLSFSCHCIGIEGEAEEPSPSSLHFHWQYLPSFPGALLLFTSVRI